MRTWLCVENGEAFVVMADTLEEAQQYAALYDGHVVQEVTCEPSDTSA